MSEEMKKIKISDLPTASNINDEDVLIKSDYVKTSKITADSIAGYVTKKVPVYTHPDSGVTPGTYKSVTVDEQGHVTAGANPDTLSGYGITDALSASDVREWAKAETKPAYTASEVGADEAGSASAAYENAKSYTNTKIAELINGAPTTLDTLGEIAEAMSNNQNVVEALDGAIGTKANQTNLDEHTGNAAIHLAGAERANWNDANSKKHEHGNKTTLDAITAAFTTSEKNKLSGIEAGAQKNTVTGIKGNAESSYRTGNVNITPSNIGLGNVNNTADSDKSVKYAGSAGSVAWDNINGKPSSYPPSGHSHSYLPLSGGQITGPIYTEGTTMKLISNSYLNLQSNNIQCRTYDDYAWSGISAASFTNQSSRRYKENIEDITDEAARQLLDYRVVSYDYINKRDGQGCLGLIAEEVAEVNEYPVIRDAEGRPDKIDYTRFVPQLIRMVQLQQEEIDQLKAHIQ